MIKTKDRIPPIVETEDYIRVPIYAGHDTFDVATLPKAATEEEIFLMIQEVIKDATDEWVYVPLKRMRLVNE
jgi:hypothetical protein